jgi:succinate dehydrogenase/fumarate reductase flavoprotein subunit
MKYKDTKLTRRGFLGLAAATASLATLSKMSLKEENEYKKEKVNPDSLSFEERECDVLVVGSGMAGLFASVKAHDSGAKVIMVSKGALGTSGQTPFAKGIFSYDEKKEKVSIDEFVNKVSNSALGTNNKAYTRQLALYSKQRVEELKEWGFFDSPLYYESFSKPIKERNIQMHQRVMITNLIKQDGKIAGATGFCLDDKKIITFKAKSVVLCTGAGGFKPNGFPICDLTHDGTIMAYKIGAKVTGKEWNDGHHASSKNPGDSFGNWHGMFEEKPNITKVEIRHDLGVDLNFRAYVDGGISKMQFSEAKSDINGPYVPEEFQRRRTQRPPSDDAHNGGRPPGMSENPTGGSSAGLAIHKSEGLVPINDKCESTIKGLYAAGDALGSHMSGGIYTQIGSSLAGSAVQGAIAGQSAAKYAQNVKDINLDKQNLASIHKNMIAPLKRENGYSPAWVTQTLQGVMIPNFVLYIKSEAMLQGALAFVDELLNHHVPKLKASDMHELRLAHETENMIINAKMKLKASMMRKESRCSHYRLDYPNVDDKNWRAWINIYKDEQDNMVLEKQAFDTWAV